MTIRTPDDEIDRPGYFYPPFKEGWNYQGITYGGHSDFSVDFNRRTLAGGWLQDQGDPVYAQANGTVAEVNKDEGVVFINHHGGLDRTESRHMTDISVKVGQRVKRGDPIGKIGAVGISADSGFTPSPHLHVVHWKRANTGEPFQRTKLSFYGDPIETSVWNSDSQPKSWKPPAPVNVVGPPKPATWEGAYKEAARALTKAEAKIATQQARIDSLTTERDAALARVAELEATPPDCSLEVDRAITAEQKIADALAVLTR